MGQFFEFLPGRVRVLKTRPERGCIICTGARPGAFAVPGMRVRVCVCVGASASHWHVGKESAFSGHSRSASAWRASPKRARLARPAACAHFARRRRAAHGGCGPARRRMHATRRAEPARAQRVRRAPHPTWHLELCLNHALDSSSLHPEQQRLYCS